MKQNGDNDKKKNNQIVKSRNYLKLMYPRENK